MQLVLCTREDSMLPLNTDICQEAESQEIVKSVLMFFRSFIDSRPYSDIAPISVRADNVLRQQRASTIGDVKRVLTQISSSQGVPGAGHMVKTELEGLIRASLN